MRSQRRMINPFLLLLHCLPWIAVAVFLVHGVFHHGGSSFLVNPVRNSCDYQCSGTPDFRFLFLPYFANDQKQDSDGEGNTSERSCPLCMIIAKGGGNVPNVPHFVFLPQRTVLVPRSVDSLTYIIEYIIESPSPRGPPFFSNLLVSRINQLKFILENRVG